MSKRNYKQNQAIRVVYQAPGAETGLTDVTMEIWDETGSLDAVNFPDVTMTEKGTSGRYIGSFTPDEEGEWEVHISHNSQTEGKVVKQYSVGKFNLNEVGDDVVVIKDKVNAIDAPPMIG